MKPASRLTRTPDFDGATARFTEDISAKAGQVIYMDAVVHDPENVTDKPFEVIAVEIVAKPCDKRQRLYGESKGMACLPFRRYTRKSLSVVNTWQGSTSSAMRTRQASAMLIG